MLSDCPVASKMCNKFSHCYKLPLVYCYALLGSVFHVLPRERLIKNAGWQRLICTFHSVTSKSPVSHTKHEAVQFCLTAN